MNPATDSTIPLQIHSQMDRVARHHRAHYNMPNLIPTPTDHIHLQDSDGEITSNEKATLENNWTTYRIERYYAKRWNCTMEHLSEFDWQTYAATYRRASATLQKYMIKMMTGWLPVYHHNNKMTKVQQLCFRCQNDETIAHLFQCGGRDTWRQNFLQILHNQLQHLHTPSELLEQIYNQIQHLITDSLNHQHFSHFNMFAGLIPLYWRHQKIDKNLSHDKNIQQQRTWARQVSTWFLHRGHELWLARNKEAHSTEITTSTMDYILNQKIDQLYSQANNINYHDRDIFHDPVEEKYKLSEKQKTTWIEQTTKTLKKCTEDHQKKMRTGQKDIRQFFDSRKVSS